MFGAVIGLGRFGFGFSLDMLRGRAATTCGSTFFDFAFRDSLLAFAPLPVSFRLDSREICGVGVIRYNPGMTALDIHLHGMISELRAAGLSVAEISERSGLSRMAIWRMSNADCRKPLYRTVKAIEQLLDEVRTDEAANIEGR